MSVASWDLEPAMIVARGCPGRGWALLLAAGGQPQTSAIYRCAEDEGRVSGQAGRTGGPRGSGQGASLAPQSALPGSRAVSGPTVVALQLASFTDRPLISSLTAATCQEGCSKPLSFCHLFILNLAAIGSASDRSRGLDSFSESLHLVCP